MLASKGPWRRGEGQWGTGQQRRTLQNLLSVPCLAARTRPWMCWKLDVGAASPWDPAEAEGRNTWCLLSYNGA